MDIGLYAVNSGRMGDVADAGAVDGGVEEMRVT